MNKGILAVLGVGLVLGGAGLIGGLTGSDDDAGNVADAGTVQADGGQTVPSQVQGTGAYAQTKADNLRLAYKAGACPANATVPRAEKAKGKGPLECAAMVQGDGYCMCWTQQEAGDSEEEITGANELPAPDRKRGIVCCPKDPKLGVPEVRWEKDEGEPATDCHVFARPINSAGVAGVESDLDVRAREACAPCPVSAGNWGQCPQCLCAPGGCAEVCR